MNNEDNHINGLIAKWLSGTASREEVEMVRKWAKESNQRVEILENMQKAWREKSPEPILVNADEKINEIWEKGMGRSSGNLGAWRTFIKYSAAVILITASLFGAFLIKGEFKQEEITGQQAYVFRKNLAGQKTKIHLPDGSIAYLNSASSIKYPSGFSQEERRVELTGEAYFEVARNKQKPFIVESHGVETIALGTAFNVNAYSGLSGLRISLLEGSVKVRQIGNEASSLLLFPGREARINPSSNELKETSFDAEEVIGWKEGKLTFKNARFDEIKLKLERWFGVKIQVDGQRTGDWNITTIYEGQTLENILIDLQYSKKFNYEINQEKVTIKF